MKEANIILRIKRSFHGMAEKLKIIILAKLRMVSILKSLDYLNCTWAILLNTTYFMTRFKSWPLIIKLTFLWSTTQKPPFNCSIIYWLCLNSIVLKLDEEIWNKGFLSGLLWTYGTNFAIFWSLASSINKADQII